ncbi:hypothetical protein D3C87_1703400 [compost metagenome]
MLNKIKLIKTVGVKCDIEAVAEEAFSTNLELVTKFLGVLDRCLKTWIAGSSLFAINRHTRFELCHFFT